MTSKEALQDLRKDARNHLDHHTKYLNERLDVIEKDLEALEVFMKHTYCTVGYEIEGEWAYYETAIPTEAEDNIIQEAFKRNKTMRPHSTKGK